MLIPALIPVFKSKFAKTLYELDDLFSRIIY